MLLSLHEVARIIRRMHNKLVVADGSLANSGGRNIADDYFGHSEPAGFIDMDILSAGAVVAELRDVFERYWTSRHAYPIELFAQADAASRAALGQQLNALPQRRMPAAPRSAAPVRLHPAICCELQKNQRRGAPASARPRVNGLAQDT